MENRNSNKIKSKKIFLIIILCLTTCVMAMEFTLYSRNIESFSKISVDGNTGAKWKVEIVKDFGTKCTKSNNDVYVKSWNDSYNAYFNIKFKNVGDSALCEVYIKNYGNLNARAFNIRAYDERQFNTGPIRIQYYGIDTDMHGLKNGTKLAPGQINTLFIKFEYKEPVVDEKDLLKTAQIGIDYIQDN